MPLEATMLVIDNSEWMRNGDYPPSRWDAQADAVNILFDAKTNSHPENMVGILTMAGQSPEVLASLTQDIGKVFAAIHASKLAGSLNLVSGINVAQLALKHRQNKNQRQRVIAFVGSPVSDSEEGLVQLAKKLKKNNVAVDIVNFGEDAQNESKLAKFLETVNSNDTAIYSQCLLARSFYQIPYYLRRSLSRAVQNVVLAPAPATPSMAA